MPVNLLGTEAMRMDMLTDDGLLFFYSRRALEERDMTKT